MPENSKNAWRYSKGGLQLVLSMLGIGLLTTNVSISDGISVWTWDLDRPFVLAVIAVVLLSLGMTCVSRSARELGKDSDAPITASLIARLGRFVATLPALFFLDFEMIQASTETVAYVLFYGIVILTISNFAYYKGISISRTHLVNVVFRGGPVSLGS